MYHLPQKMFWATRFELRHLRSILDVWFEPQKALFCLTRVTTTEIQSLCDGVVELGEYFRVSYLYLILLIKGLRGFINFQNISWLVIVLYKLI